MRRLGWLLVAGRSAPRPERSRNVTRLRALRRQESGLARRPGHGDIRQLDVGAQQDPGARLPDIDLAVQFLRQRGNAALIDVTRRSRRLDDHDGERKSHADTE
jgi:hypothetical protein